MTNFYLVPIVKNTIDKIVYRDPAFVKGRVSTGLDIGYSFFDFGHKSDYGVLVCDELITDKDAYIIQVDGSLTQKKKNNLKSALKAAGLDDIWTGNAQDWREAVHRLLGLSQAMQSAEDDPKKPAGEDDPSKWLGRFIHAGKVNFTPLNLQAFEAEQKTIKKSKELIVQDFFKMGMSKKLFKRATSQMFFALPASDTFTANDGTLLTDYSANWVNNRLTYKISSNRAGQAAAGEGMCHWGADAFGDDQYAQATLTTLTTSGNWIGVSLRCNTSSANGYQFYAATSSGQSDYLQKLVNGTATAIDSIAGTYAVNDVIRLEITGTTLTPMKNGSTHAMGTSTDSSFSAGYAGLSGYGNAYTTNNLDTWSAGNLGATDYPITAGQASFTLTGNASNLINARKITAAQVSFTLTGQAAGLLASKKLIADYAGFIETGNDSGLLAGRVLSLSNALFVLTGYDISFSNALTIQLQYVTYSATFNDATLTYTGDAFNYARETIQADGYSAQANVRQSITTDGRRAIKPSRQTITADTRNNVQVK